ncbi:multiple cyclophane-containing RiPP AmcA [Micromonospora sp. SH-82]|uniref:multiple cyclophane-containing RiPP AmcA n=1 Tax=Micromonospora sp. SH-82 TaxID=3132938 RepID=UPI003EC15478
MTVYISSNARSGQQGRPRSLHAVTVVAADPPLFTYVWRRFFDQSGRLGVGR